MNSLKAALKLEKSTSTHAAKLASDKLELATKSISQQLLQAEKDHQEKIIAAYDKGYDRAVQNMKDMKALMSN